MSEHIIETGGWCAPNINDYDKPTPLILPELKVNRGGIDFTSYEPTPQQKAIQEHIATMVGSRTRAQSDAIDAACHEALASGWDVYLHRRYDSRFIGIAFHPGDHPVPTIHETSGWNGWDTSFDWDTFCEDE